MGRESDPFRKLPERVGGSSYVFRKLSPKAFIAISITYVEFGAQPAEDRESEAYQTFWQGRGRGEQKVEELEAAKVSE